MPRWLKEVYWVVASIFWIAGGLAFVEMVLAFSEGHIRDGVAWFLIDLTAAFASMEYSRRSARGRW